MSNQVKYSLISRNVEKDLLSFCEKNNIVILAYRPLAHGRLSKDSGELKTAIDEIRAKYGEKTPAQIALNWLMSKSKMVFPIPRASKLERILENIGTVG